jgi:hypothetical protein
VCIFYTKTKPATNSKSSDLPTQWGRGLYFAEDAAYSQDFATKKCNAQDASEQNELQPDENQMFLATLILGNTVEMDRDDDQMKKRLGGHLNATVDRKTNKVVELPCAIKAPPFVNSNPPLHEDGSGPKYNTVTGFTQGDLRQPNGKWMKNPACPRSRVW